jgi:hypothetical protein
MRHVYTPLGVDFGAYLPIVKSLTHRGCSMKRFIREVPFEGMERSRELIYGHHMVGNLHD